MAATALQQTLTTSPHLFLEPTPELYRDTLALLKQTLDPLAASISADQLSRQESQRRKRKRSSRKEESDSDSDEEGETEPLRLKRVHVDGFGVEQVWEQVRRVVAATTGEVRRDLKLREELLKVQDGEDGTMDGESAEEIDGEDDSGLGEEGVDWEYDGPDEEDSDDEIEDLDDDEGAEDVDMDDEEDLGDETKFFSAEEDFGEDDAPQQEFVADPNGLNDGFFSIDDFNKQSQFMEQADQRGDDDGAASDEEEIDWNAAPATTNGVVDEDNEEVDGDDDEDGPTFGNADLNAPEGDSEDDVELEAGEMDDIGGMGNTNNILYADFFAPPATKARKNKKGRPNPHNFPPKAQQLPDARADLPDEEAEMERTMSAVHRDLFDDESERDESDAAENVDTSDPKSRRSTHEKRRAALAEEIRRLEAANVAKREWTLSGEARATDRPLNSLLEEDLDFERAGKPVPVITAEVSESIEELIKRRILANDFQDLIRRRPDDLGTGPTQRRGRVDIDDSKPKRGLAEEYEEDHLARTDSNYVSTTDAATKAEETAIAAQWAQISAQLDSLSSWHFRPRAPAKNLEIRTDAPVVRLEDARPTATVDALEQSQLAPQEVYKAGEVVDKAAGERVTRGGGVVADEEMGRDDRKRRRRREKERKKKAGGAVVKKDDGGKESRKDVVGRLERGGVRVIGKEGVTDVRGQKVREGQAQGAGAFKL